MAKGKSITITKEWLQYLGITDVTEDGRVFYKGRELAQIKTTKHHKYGNDITYTLVAVYDKDLYQEQKKTRKIPLGQRYMLVSRIVYAWFNDICPGGIDVDHINQDTSNNHKNNLRLLTRKQNRGRSLPSNQHLCRLENDELKFYLEESKRLKEQVNRYREAYRAANELAKDKAREVSRLEGMIAKKGANKYLLSMYEDSKEELSDLRINVFYCKDKWHYSVKEYNDFKKEWKAKMEK